MSSLHLLDLATKAQVSHVKIVEVFVENGVIVLEILRFLHKIAYFSPHLAHLLSQ